MMVREKVVLSDGKDAVKITGLGASAINLRVKRTGLVTKPNGALTDTIIRAAAYVVDDAGKETGVVGPEVTVNVHGTGDLARALGTLSAHAQTAFLSAYAASVQVVPDNLPL